MQTNKTIFEYHITRRRGDSGGDTCPSGGKLNTGRLCPGGVVEVQEVSHTLNQARVEVPGGWLWCRRVAVSLAWKLEFVHVQVQRRRAVTAHKGHNALCSSEPLLRLVHSCAG
jgi:hypothetical protein